MDRIPSYLVGAALCVSCGGSPGKPAAQSTVDVASPTQGAETAAEPSKRGASALVKQHWALGESVEFALYADLDGLLSTELFRGIGAALLAQPELASTPKERECLRDVLASAREFAFGHGGEQSLAIVRYDTDAFRAGTAECLGLMAIAPTTAFGSLEAYEHGYNLLVVKPGLLLGGSREAVKAAIAANAPETQWPKALDLRPTQYLVFHGRNRDGDASGRGSLTVEPKGFRLEAEMNFADDRQAVHLETELRDGLKTGSAILGAREFFDAFTFERKGRSLLGALEVRGTTADQARTLGMASALAIYGVRKYMLQAKQAEARMFVGEIAMKYHTWYAAAPPKNKLLSFPAVPKTIPSGKKYQSAANEWKPWAKIDFSLTEPQYYQYEVIAAKDGKSAEVVARGDLDGNGKTSKFALYFQLANGELQMGPNLLETDPEE